MWRLRNWRLRTKLLAVLLIPTIAALALGGLRVRGDLANADDLAKLANEVQLESSVSTLVQQLQRERDLTVSYVAAKNKNTNAAAPPDRTVLERQIKRVSDSVDGFQRKLDELGVSLRPETADLYKRTSDQLRRLNSLRNAVVSTAYPSDAVLRTYTDSVSSLLALGEQAIATINEPELVRLHLATNAIARAKEQESRKRAILLDALQTGTLTSSGQRALLAADAELDAARNDFRKSATPDQAKIYDDKVTGVIVDNANNIEEAALTRTEAKQSLDGLTAERWDIDSTLTVNLTRDVNDLLVEQLQTRTDTLANDARTSAIRDSAIVLGALFLALLMALFVARSLLNPLRVLRRTALEVADHQLPDAVKQILADPNPQDAAKGAVQPVPVFTREEVGQVARAFDAVHGEAVRLAAEQALLRDNVNSMFVNLSRRSQALVERQLNLIDRLEQDEQDPDQLASLFELDHLATRMRRNSENLLVLSGTDLGRRLTRPVPAAEVLGAAVSEVEQYARVQVAQTPELTVQGRAVNDLVHLVAELLDNATVFSDPATGVTVRTAKTRRGELAIEIQDRGVGMLDQEIVDANERLADPPDVDVAVSRRMGLYVVARLAKRHDITVKLRANEDIEGGTTALVVVPEALVAVVGAPQQSLLSQQSMTQQSLAPQSLAQEPQSQPLPAFGDTTFSATRNSGIAGAFTGTMAKLDENGAPSVRFVQSEHDAAEAADAASLPMFGAPHDDEPEWDSVEQQPEPEPEPGSEYGQYGESTLFTAYEERNTEDEAPGFETAQFVRPDHLVDAVEYDAEEYPAAAPPLVPHASFAARLSDDSHPNGAAPAPPKEVEHDVDAPTERLPIYEAVLSQWFQAVEGETPPSPSQVVPPVRTEPDRELPAPTAPAAPEPVVPVESSVQEPPLAESGLPKRRPASALAQSSLGQRTPREEPLAAVQPQVEPQVAEQPVVEAEPVAEDLPAAPSPKSMADDRRDAWQSPGDEGWQAAQALLNSTPEVVTTAGLPKRVPKAHLVPGSAAPAKSQTQASPRTPLPPRSPDAVRGRMSSLQQGVRRGRHALIDAHAGDQPSSSSRQDEEQE
ncbi:sensor histidine kinase [Solihabitans fulvus]|nr:nitrate- and nitrite sensing domain-containing protein [Solihabitans fulvus]